MALKGARLETEIDRIGAGFDAIDGFMEKHMPALLLGIAGALLVQFLAPTIARMIGG